LFSESDDIELKYNFRFLTKNEFEEERGDSVFWFRVGEIMSMEDPSAIMKFAMKNDLMDSSKYKKKKWRVRVRRIV